MYLEREASWRRDPSEIYKCPYALLRRGFDPSEVVLCIRDPRDIVTSNSHEDHPGEFAVGWKENEGWSPSSLEAMWTSMLPYLTPKRGRGAYIVRYEDLTQRPNDLQSALGTEFDLTYNDKQWELWPLGYRYPEYWNAPIGKRRKLKPRQYRDPQRLEQQMSYPGFRQCCDLLGYP